MAGTSRHITLSLTAEQAEALETAAKSTGEDANTIIRVAISDYVKKVMNDEEGKKLAKINALLDVQ
ncbi:ribbon-helix-helix protein, CopG family [Sulfurovum sp.]|uniref:ribbon-helix-helix protein, CopG family n=1 Tax=Sulfurovum sp. TaxID=1969726 RepID=UPI0025D87086|nr:ribbon-helix-helix protein, CopG family [Sulfurovum sp.]